MNQQPTHQNLEAKQRVLDQFGRTADAYVASTSHAHGDDLGKLIRWLSPNAGAVALDVATGGGHTAKALSGHVKAVFATDLTPRMLERARDFLTEEGCCNISYVLADAERLPFLSCTFDIVTCRIAAHHFPNPEGFISEVARVLKPGGQFVLIDNVAPEEEKQAAFMNTFETMRDPSHVRCLPRSEWMALFHAAHLQVNQDEVWRKPFLFQPWLSRMATSKTQYDAVERLFLDAPADILHAYDVSILDGHVESLLGFSWMALCTKKAASL